MPAPIHVHVYRDLPCIRCGYNLKTLAADGICPECGCGIADSVARFDRKERERQSEPWPGCRRWLKRLVPSPVLMLGAMVLAFSPARSFDESVGNSAAGWALAILAILWLSRSPGPPRMTGIPAGWRWLLRLLAAALVAPVVLVVIDLATWNGPVVNQDLCLLFAGMSMLATFLYYGYLSIVFWQIRQHGWARAALVAAFAGSVAAVMCYMPTIGRFGDYPWMFHKMPVPGTVSHEMAQAVAGGIGFLLIVPPIGIACSGLVLLHAIGTFWRRGRRQFDQSPQKDSTQNSKREEKAEHASRQG